MRNKKGFTLAEVLITLGIIGVVAALTAPGLILQSRNAANASRLQVMMGNVENAFATAVADPQNNADVLQNTPIWRAGGVDLISELSRYLHITGAPNRDRRNEYTNLNGGVGRAVNGTAVATKNGAIIYIDTSSLNAADNGATPIVGTVVIDVNGTNDPNQWGRDVFGFVVGDDGTLYPYGGEQANDADDIPDNCDATGVGCAAQVIETGRIDY